jgi:hypothetical protein
MKIRKESNIINLVNQQISKMNKGEISTYYPVVALNVSDLNSPIQRCRLTGWILQLEETNSTDQDTQKLKVKGRKMIFQENGI